MGTAPYMSPEQARGLPVDRRTDVWAFGAVVYEMLAGRRAFLGRDVTETLAEILKGDVDYGALPKETPRSLRRLIERCLRRDPHRRLRDLADVRLELEELGAEGAAAPGGGGGRVPRSLAVPLAAATLGALLVGVLLGRAPWRRPERAFGTAVVRSTIELEPGVSLEGFAGMSVAISPDGRTLAYVGVGADGQHVYIRRLDQPRAARVEGSETGEGLFFSPDGRWLAFATGVTGGGIDTPQRLWKVPVDGGSPRVITPIEDSFGGSWGEDGSIVFVNVWGRGLWRVSADGGTPAPIELRVDEGEPPRWLMWPRHVPGTHTLLVSDYGAPLEGDARLLAVDLETGRARSLGLAGTTVVASRDELLFSGYDATLSLVGWAPAPAETRGPPRSVLKGLSVSGVGASLFAASAEGTLVYSEGPVKNGVNQVSHVVRIAGGNVDPLAGFPAGRHADLSLSPDGRKLAVASQTEGIWVVDLVRGSRLRLHDDSAIGCHEVRWTPDGRSLVYTADGAGSTVHIQPADGTAPPRPLTHGADQAPGSITPDGRLLLFHSFEGRGDNLGYDLWQLELDGAGSAGEPRRIVSAPGHQMDPVVSPTGDWLAYATTESGGSQISLQPWPALDRRLVVSVDGGRSPRWSPNGKELYYLSGDRVMRVRVERGDVSPPREGLRLEGLQAFDVAADGTFYGVRLLPEENRQTRLNLVQGWPAALNQEDARRRDQGAAGRAGE